VFLGDWVARIPMAALVAVMIMVSIGTFSWGSLANLKKHPASTSVVRSKARRNRSRPTRGSDEKAARGDMAISWTGAWTASHRADHFTTATIGRPAQPEPGNCAPMPAFFGL
jgi:hypothetical protein